MASVSRSRLSQQARHCAGFEPDGDDFKKRRTGAPGTVRHPSASYGRVTPDGGQLMKPILKSVPVSVAMAALASLAAAGCGTVTGATPNPALTAQAAFAGYKWTV